MYRLLCFPATLAFVVVVWVWVSGRARSQHLERIKRKKRTIELIQLGRNEASVFQRERKARAV